jgi:hypothetical protein
MLSRVNFQHLLIFSIIIFIGCFAVYDFVKSDNQNVNVYLTVPSSGGGGGATVDSIPPVISDIVVNPNYTTGTVLWTATDETELASCSFDYGLTELYGWSAVPLQVDSGFTANLFGLTTGTLYYFMIHCIDMGGNSTIATGTLATLSPEFYRNLVIVAKPEKRIYKIGGNYQANAFLLLYDGVTKIVQHIIEVNLDQSGTTTVQVEDVLTGNYEAILKTESHLAKRIIGISIENNFDPILDFTEVNSFYLLAGDVQGEGLKDNFVDILDISATDIKFNSNHPVFDLNRDNIVDVLDMSAVLVNYNKQGDPI